MNDSDAIPLPTSESGISSSEVENLWAAGAGAFDTHRTPASSAWQPPSVESLQALLPQYEISAFIARGGMGAVYKGMQRALKRSVAIKIMPPRMDHGGMQFAVRFKQEAQAMAHLAHPNIVAVYEAGEVNFEQAGMSSGMLLYFVMEFIEGTDVAQLIASEGALEPSRAVPIITAVCEALAFAHDEGIVHRDIKPSNIMIDRRGRVKVADFGLAKAVNLSSELMTRSDLAMGTPDFMAPEALLPGLIVDGRADIYAVGVMLYQMLTGRIPRGRFESPSDVVPKIGRSFDAIVDKAMQTDREKRYSTAIQVKMDLENASMKGAAVTTDGSDLEHNRQPSSLSAATKAEEQPKAATFSAKMGALITAAILLMVGLGAVILKQGPAKALNATGVSTETSTRAIPARPPSYVPGRWVKVWQRPEDIPNAAAVTEGWTLMKSVSPGVHLPGAKGLNWGVRGRFLLGQGAPPPQLQLRDTKGTGYNLIPLYDYLRFRRNDLSSQNRVLELGKHHMSLSKAGEEITLEFIIIDRRLIARLDGRTFTMVLDPATNPPQPGDVSIYQVDRNAFRDVEAINLDGLSEAEALKATGVDLNSATTVDPSKSYTFPAGQWVNPFQEASDLEFSLIKRGTTWKDGWIIPDAASNRTITLSTLNAVGKNWGMRARYRWQEKAIATLNLRRMPASDKSYVTHDFVVTGEQASFCLNTTYSDGTPATATTLGKPYPVKLSAGDEVLVEAFAIGATLYGRVNGQTFQMSTVEASERASFLASTVMMSFRDIEFINLDGLSESEARAAAGVAK